MKFIVVLDACVLYSAPLRDFILRLALTGLFAAKWTKQIQDEWIGRLSEKRPDIAKNLPRTRELMERAIPDCLVTNYEGIIGGLNLPDPDDNHVLAAALRSHAQMIVTFNLTDFPKEELEKYGIEAVHPDVFVENQLDLHQGAVVRAAKKHRESLNSPPKSPEEYLDTLSAQGLVVTADRLQDFLDLI